MKLTVKDMAQVLNFLEVAQRTTESAWKGSKPGSTYNECMKRQLLEVEALIQKIEGAEI